jgi:hypothetical protein
MRVLSRNYGFLLKIGVTILLVIAFDWLFPHFLGGTTIGAFAFLWLLGLILARPAVRRPQLSAAIALSLATLFCIALAYDPGPLAWALFWSALSIAALLPRTAGFDDAWRWAARLLLQGLSGPITPAVDLLRLTRLRSRGGKVSLRSLTALLALPLIGTALFTVLFANANPVIADVLSRIQLPTPAKLIEWTLVTLLVWPALRPHRIVTGLCAHLPEPGIRLPGASLPSVLLALGLFNALFALQNGLDIAFLWSGAPLPAGMSMTEYVHRGAYPLIGTALLAGFFVITMLRQGTATAANPLARRLVALWVTQNIFLVASSALRTIDYIEQFELTAWRIAALAWMGLVATGLLLICWRMWFARSARWLINANALAASLMLIPCCFVDLDAIAATWNVRHAREVGGAGSTIDLCYLREMGASALLPLIELERRPLPVETLDRVRDVRGDAFDRLAARQATWQGWTPHGASRLARAQALLGSRPPRPQPLKAGATRNCDGAPSLTDAPAQ